MDEPQKNETEPVKDVGHGEEAGSERVMESVEEKRKRLPTSLPVGGIITPV